MNIDEVRSHPVVATLLKAARQDAAIGRCSTCGREVRWSEARRPFTAPPVHADCAEPLRDDRTRTPPHGDALLPERGGRPSDAKLAVDIAKRTPVGVAPIYRALFHHSAEEVEAAIAAAASAGVDPSSFPVYLPGRDRWPAIHRAMAGPAIPHSEAGVPYQRAPRSPCGPHETGGVMDVGQWFLDLLVHPNLDQIVKDAKRELEKTYIYDRPLCPKCGRQAEMVMPFLATVKYAYLECIMGHGWKTAVHAEKKEG